MITTRTHLPEDGPFSRAQLDAIGDHTHEFEESDVNSLTTSVREQLGTGVAGINYLRNADQRLWSAGVGPTALPANNRTTLADHWWARPDAGAFPTGERSADTAHDNFLFATILKGATSCTRIDLGQELSAAVAAALHPTAVLTLEIENLTGANLTPTVYVDTCDSFENYSAVTNRVAQVADSAAANAERKTWTIALNLADFADELKLGALVYVRIPNLTASTKFVKVYAMKLESGATATPIAVERDAASTSSGGSGGGGGGGGSTSTERNYFGNSNLAAWQDATLTCVEDTDNYAAREFFAQPSDGDTMTYARVVDVPDSRSLYSAELTGHADVSGTVDFGQVLRPFTAAEARRQLVFSAQIFNDTGAVITPTLRVDTFSAPLALRTAANVLAAPLQPCANGGWTTVSYTFNGADLANMANGARVYLRLDAGTLDNGSKSVRFAQLRLEPGSAPTTFLPAPELFVPAHLNGAARNLRLVRTNATTVTLTYDEIIVKDAAGRALCLRTGSHTIALGTTGLGGVDDGTPTADNWYDVYVCSNGVTRGAFISKDAAPVLPDGHLFHAQVSTVRVRTIGSIAFEPFTQNDHVVYITPTQVFSGAKIAPALDQTWKDADAMSGATALSTLVPPRAIAALITYGTSDKDQAVRMEVAAQAGSGTDAGIGSVYVNSSAAGGSTFSGFGAAISGYVPIFTPQKLYVRSRHNQTEMKLVVNGYVLP